MDEKEREYFQNARMPQGEAGQRMLATMNQGTHARLAEWAFSCCHPQPGDWALDVGCGGGANLKRLLAFCSEGNVIGVDHSPTSVEASRQLCAEERAAERCSVLLGSAVRLPVVDGCLDFVTAFETVYFWGNLEQAFAEVRRVLAPGGTFMICNEVDGTHEEDFRMVPVIEGMTVHTPYQVGSALARAGFTLESTEHKPGEGWVAYIARKPQD